MATMEVTKVAINKGGARPAENILPGIYTIVSMGKNWGKATGNNIPTLILQDVVDLTRCRVTAAAFFDTAKRQALLTTMPFTETKLKYKLNPEVKFFFYAFKYSMLIADESELKEFKVPKEHDHGFTVV